MKYQTIGLAHKLVQVVSKYLHVNKERNRQMAVVL